MSVAKRTDLSAGEPPSAAWHALAAAEVLAVLESRKAGLTEAEAQFRLASVGPNVLPQQPPPTVWQIFLRQFLSPLIYLLLAATVVSLVIGHFDDAVFIAAVLLINAVIGTIQEWKAEQSSRALQKLLRIRATVVRDGEVKEIPADQVVPGDIVWLEPGNRVPADVRLLWSHALEIDESLLTGESLGVLKDHEWSGPPATPVADRLNMAHAGTLAIRGRGKGIVVATGSRTVVGQLALDVMAARPGKPPLIERMERFARAIAGTVLAAVAVLALIGVLVHGHGLTETFTFAVALAVSAVPEGLPVALTVALAVATNRMARRGVIVRRLAAVEGLGSATLIASDKTGTLTCNELTVRQIRVASGAVFEVTGEGFTPHGQVLLDGKPVEPGTHPELNRLARAAVLCNEAELHLQDSKWTWRGDPTDVALLSMAHKLGWNRELTLDRHPQVNEIPFEPEHRFAASYHQMEDGSVYVFVKGAPERVLAMCNWADESDRQRQLAVASEMASQGYRVLALAEGPAPAHLDTRQTPPEPTGLTLLGFVGMIDPLRPGVREAVASCHAAGITVCMVTGDHPVTALAIARDLGLASQPDQVVTGRELEAMTAEQLQLAVERVRVFARVTPRQKLELVEAAKRAGHYVVVTGDGVNDAPALKAAHIGVAMGRSGTDVAREAADLVICDDNFATIVAGVEEGRVAYDNIRKVIYLLVSTGAAEIVMVALAVATGLPLPLLPVQLLWLNLVTNGIQHVGLAFEPSEGDVLRRKPRPPGEPIFNQLMIERTVLAAVVMGVVGFSAFAWMLQNGWSEDSARNALLLLMVLFENIHIGNCRSETKSGLVLSPFRSPILLIGTITAFLVHVVSMYLAPMQVVLRTEPVSPGTWASLLALALTIFVVMEIHKFIWAIRHRNV